VTTAEATSGLAAQFGAFIQGKSTIKATITAAGAKGSTIKKYSTTFQGKTYTGSTWTSAAVQGSGSLSLVTTVTDSRGRTAKRTTTINVLAYSTPKVTEFQAFRANTSGSVDDQGTRASISFAYAVTSLGGKNTAHMRITYKRSTETTWSDPLTNSYGLTNSGIMLLSATFSTDYQYDLRMQVTDWFGATSTYTVVLPSGAVIVDLAANGKGMGVGKTAEQDGLDLGWDIVGQALTAANMSGKYKTHDGLLIQWARPSITPTAADEMTTLSVTFPEAYAFTPAVIVTPVTTVPQNLSTAPSDITTTGFKLQLIRNGTTTTGVQWVAIGKAK
jgi:hypothetical protein